MNGCDLMEEIARLKEDRDRLIDESIAAFPFSWEDGHDADCDGC